MHRFLEILPALAVSIAVLAAAAPRADAAAGTATHEGGGGAQASWHTEVKSALERAADGDRYVLVDLYADWCGWCKVLEDEVFTGDDFLAFAADKVLLRVDVEDGADGSELRARYGISSLPTMLILDAAGVQVGAVQGYAPAPAYLASLRAEIARYEASLVTYERVLASGGLEARWSMAEAIHGRGDGKRALALYESIAEGYELDVAELAELALARADAQRLIGDYAAATASIGRAGRLAENLADPLLAERVDLLGARIAQDAGDCERAETSLEAFLRDHPRSPRRREAKQALWYLRQASACS